MVKRKSFGTEISGSRRFNHEFTTEQRAAMCMARDSGKTYREIAVEFNCNASTVQRTFKRWQNHQTLKSKVRKGRPKKLSQSAIKYLLFNLKRNRKITWNDLLTEGGYNVSRRTAQRALGRYWGRKWRALRRIPLSKETARIRLQWCRAWKEDEEALSQVFRFFSPLSKLLYAKV